MQISYLGFTWEATRLDPDKPAPTREQALAAIAGVPLLGQRAKAYQEAWAAYQCADYGHAVARARAAEDFAEAAAWDALDDVPDENGQ